MDRPYGQNMVSLERMSLVWAREVAEDIDFFLKGMWLIR
jgi:hypothetical protein